MATFRILEDENAMMDRNKRKFEEDVDVNENIPRKNGNHQRIALQCLINNPQIDVKRVKKCEIRQVHEVVVEERKNEDGEDEGTKKEEVVDLVHEEVNLKELQLTEPEKNCNFTTDMKRCDEYREDIFQYLTQLELRYEWPARNCIEKQSELTADMRSVLVDWMVSIGAEYKLSPQTVHLAVNYVDRFISKMLVVTQKFQLVGAAAMLVAGKLEEIYPPDTKELVYLSGDAYTIAQIVKMEQLMLKVLKFDVQPPTMLSFIKHICTEHKLDKKTLNLSMYFSELVLLDGVNFFQYLPSKLAASSVALARLTLSKRKPWPKQLDSFTGYTLKQLSPVVMKQQKAFQESPKKPHKAVHTKYLTDKYHNVAALKPKNLSLAFLGEE